MAMWEARFRSAKFLPFLPEDQQIKPGVYGFEFAAWLSRNLAQRAIATTYPLAEDWGWFFEHSFGDIKFIVGCASVCSEGEGYLGRPVEWRVFIQPKKSLKYHLNKYLGEVEFVALRDAVKAALAEAEAEIVTQS